MAATAEQGAPGNGRAVAAVVFGLLSAATMPVAIVATRYSGSYELLQAVLGISMAATGLVALAVYGLLTYLGERT